jgi:hypothetical protein
MNGQPALATHKPLSLAEKLRVCAACVASAILFAVVGHMVLEPSNAGAALSFIAQGHVLSVLGYAVLLVGAAALVGVLIVPGRLEDAACLVAAFGLAWENWAGGSMQYMLYYVAPEADARAGLFLHLALETLLWALLMVEAMLVGRGVKVWLDAAGAPASDSPSTARKHQHAADVPRSVGAAAVCAVVAALVISQVAGRSPVSPIEKGQIYFAVGLAFYLGTLVASYVVYAVRPVYFLGAVWAVATAAYCWAWRHPFADLAQTPYEGFQDVVPMALARPLPVEYLSLGTIGALLGCWSAHKIYVFEGAEQ